MGSIHPFGGLVISGNNGINVPCSIHILHNTKNENWHFSSSRSSKYVYTSFPFAILPGLGCPFPFHTFLVLYKPSYRYCVPGFKPGGRNLFGNADERNTREQFPVCKLRYSAPALWLLVQVYNIQENWSCSLNDGFCRETTIASHPICLLPLIPPLLALSTNV